MEISDEKRKALISYRIEQAFETVRETEFMIEKGMRNYAVSRIYYGMFYAVQAIAVREDFETSKHKQLIGWFNKNFINTGLLPKNFGRMIMDMLENRIESDYKPFVQYNEIETKAMFNDLKLFIATIDDFLKEK